MPEAFPISEDEISTGIQPALQSFLARSGDYDAVSSASQQLIERDSGAYFVPDVKFILDATLDTLNQNDVQPKLPQEVYERQAVASQLAEEITEKAMESDAFVAYHLADQYLRLNVERLSSLTAPSYLQLLGGAPFSDVRIVAGGAMRFMQELGMEENPVELIGRSRRLLAVSYINKKYARLAQLYIGEPYASTDMFRLIQTENGREITFDNVTRELMIHRWRVDGKGCPAGKIALHGASQPNLLEEYWQRIVDYLLPPSATVNGF